MMTRKKLLIDWNLLEMMLLLMVQVLPLRQFCILKTQVRDQWVKPLDRKRPRTVKEFRDVAYRLKEGQVSEPFETEYGCKIF